MSPHTSRLWALDRDLDWIELIDLGSGNREGIITASGEAIYVDADDGIHIVAPGETTTGKQLALDSQGRLYWATRRASPFSVINRMTPGTAI